MKMSNLFIVILIFYGCLNKITATSHHEHGHLDVFDEILKTFSVTGEYLSTVNLEGFIDTIFHSVTCTATNGPDSCNETICLSTTDLVSLVGGSPTQGVNESQFDDVAVVLLYHLKHLNAFCRKYVNITENVDFYLDNFVHNLLAPGMGNATSEVQIEEVLEALNKSWTPHEHEGDEEHGDHAGEVHVFQEECLAADLVMHHLGNGSVSIEREHFGEIAALIAYQLFDQSQIKHECRMLPKDSFFIDELFEHFNAVNDTITTQELKNIFSKLKITPVIHEGDVHLHNERKKRSIKSEEYSRSKRAAHDHGHEEAGHSETKTCYSPEQILAIYDTTAPISKIAFSQLCPSLIFQQVSDSCRPDEHTEVEKIRSMPTTAQRYGFGTLAVIIITSCSIFGAILFPCTKDKCYNYFMAVFMGLAVGTLTSDAFLHLLPEAFAIHKHGHDDHDHSSGSLVIEPFVWYALTAIGGVYMFYLLESIFGLLGHGHSHNLNHDDMSNRFPVSSAKSNHLELQEREIQSIAGLNESPRELRHLALMIIIGDAIHNFADGLAIGAAFTHGVSEGFSVSLAVFCHELPHELGDFAVLLRTNMKFRNAIFWNLISGMTAFIGLYIGLSVSEDATARQWIFAVTAGMFVYIALVDILPQLTHPSSIEIFIMTNVGIILGITIMLLISIFEGQLEVKV